MPTRNLELTDHQEALIGRLVESGRYQNASEVLREGLRLVEQRESENALRLTALRRAVDAADRDLAEGRYEVLGTAEEIADYLDGLESDGGR